MRGSRWLRVRGVTICHKEDRPARASSSLRSHSETAVDREACSAAQTGITWRQEDEKEVGRVSFHFQSPVKVSPADFEWNYLCEHQPWQSVFFMSCIFWCFWSAAGVKRHHWRTSVKSCVRTSTVHRQPKASNGTCFLSICSKCTKGTVRIHRATVRGTETP